MAGSKADCLAPLSSELREAVRRFGFERRRTQYSIAREVGFDPATFSGLMNGRRLVDVGEPRIEKLAALVGVPDFRCFQL